jgi:hypothetical protein
MPFPLPTPAHGAAFRLRRPAPDAPLVVDDGELEADNLNDAPHTDRLRCVLSDAELGRLARGKEQRYVTSSAGRVTTPILAAWQGASARFNFLAHFQEFHVAS